MSQLDGTPPMRCWSTFLSSRQLYTLLWQTRPWKKIEILSPCLIVMSERQRRSSRCSNPSCHKAVEHSNCSVFVPDPTDESTGSGHRVYGLKWWRQQLQMFRLLSDRTWPPDTPKCTGLPSWVYYTFPLSALYYTGYYFSTFIVEGFVLMEQIGLYK